MKKISFIVSIPSIIVLGIFLYFEHNQTDKNLLQHRSPSINVQYCHESKSNTQLGCIFSIDKNTYEARLTNSGVDIFLNNELLISTSSYAAKGMFEQNDNRTFGLSTLIKTKDVTFDGYEDLLVLDSYGAYMLSYTIYPFIPETKTFTLNPGLVITEPSVDVENKILKSFIPGRSIGDIYTKKDYVYKNNEFVLIRVETQDFYKENPDDEIGYPGQEYIRTVEELVNGELTIISKERIKNHY